MKERIKWIDSIKGIIIFLVVLGHITLNESLLIYIFSFHIPLFFFISGYLYKSEKYKNFKVFLKKKSRTIIIPYLTFSAISYVFWVFQEMTGAIKGFSIPFYMPLIGTLYSNGTGMWLEHNVALWFLTCLFVTETIGYFAIKRAGNYLTLSIILIAFSFLGFIDSLYMPIRLPWGFDVALTAIVFYGFGFILKQKKGFLQLFIRKGGYIILFFMVSVIYSSLNGVVDMNKNLYGNYFYYYIAAFSGIMLYIYIAKFLEGNKILHYLGKNSLIILGLHLLVLYSANIPLNRFMPSLSAMVADSVLLGMLYSIIVIILLIPVIYALNRFFPSLIGKT